MSKKTNGSNFKRGFKSWCENVSLQHRKEMSLQPIDPINPRALAEKLGVIVWKADEVPGIGQKTLDVLTKDDPESWSAMTLCGDGKNIIVLNPMNSPGRMNSDLTHELSHIIIGHEAARIDITPDNMLMLRNYDKGQEEEANWLAGCLLLPRLALLHIRKKGLDKSDVKKIYGVSTPMLDYRLRMTGVDRQLSYARVSN